MKFLRGSLGVTLALLVFTGNAKQEGLSQQNLELAQEPRAQLEKPLQFERKSALEYSQAAIGRQTGNYQFYDQQGRLRHLQEFKGKPLVISLIYTSCYHICPTTTQHLKSVVDKARKSLGHDSFHVVTVGFDSNHDTADAMRSFAKKQNADWDFLAADKSGIESLSQDLGFLFYPSGHGFDHLNQSTILDANGVVYRQVYGIRFDTPHLIEPLKQLVFGEKSSVSFLDQITDRIKLFCTVYDPASDSYRFDYSIFVGLVMGLSLGFVAVYIVVREWRVSQAHRKKSSIG